MSGLTIVARGDTFEGIARKKYGSERYAPVLVKANPGATEPLSIGLKLVVPSIPGTPTDQLGQALSANENEVGILIDGKRFRYWSDIRLTFSIDAVFSVEFSAPFEPEAPGFREAFRPFSFAPVVITVGGQIVFTGTLITVTPNLADQQKIISVSAYATPGVLGDCTASASAYPVEFNNQTLSEIAAVLAEPFSILVETTGPRGVPFERVALEPGDTILNFLSDLARQRSLVLSNTSTGALLIQQSVTDGEPVVVLVQGESPLVSVSPSFSPQQYYTHITGLESAYTGSDGSQYTVKNPHLLNQFRPFVFNSPDVEGGDIQTAVEAKAGRMFGNMVSYSVELSTWRDPSGNLWTPNTLVSLEAPNAMIYEPYTFLIRSVSFEKSSNEEKAVLDLVMPGAFSGGIPEVLPWD